MRGLSAPNSWVKLTFDYETPERCGGNDALRRRRILQPAARNTNEHPAGPKPGTGPTYRFLEEALLAGPVGVIGNLHPPMAASWAIEIVVITNVVRCSSVSVDSNSHNPCVRRVSWHAILLQTGRSWRVTEVKSRADGSHSPDSASVTRIETHGRVLNNSPHVLPTCSWGISAELDNRNALFPRSSQQILFSCSQTTEKRGWLLFQTIGVAPPHNAWSQIAVIS